MSKKMGADKTLLERLSELEAVIEADDDGIVSPEEYVIFNLKQMGKVSPTPNPNPNPNPYPYPNPTPDPNP